MRRRLVVGIQVALAIAILVVLARQIDIHQLPLIFARARYGPLAFAIIMLIPGFLMRSWRLQVIANYNARRKITAGQSLIVTLVGSALNLVMPGSAGEVVRAYYAYLYTGDKDGMLVASVLDKFAALVALFAIGATALFLADPSLFDASISGIPIILSLKIATSTIFVILVIVFFEGRVIPWRLVERLLNAVLKAGFKADRMRVIWSLPLRLRALVLAQSLVGWLLTYVSFYGIILAFSDRMTFADILLIGPVINLLPFIPITVAGMGTMEAAIFYFLKKYGIDESSSVLIAFLYRMLCSILPGLFGAYYLFKLRRAAPPTEISLSSDRHNTEINPEEATPPRG